MTDIKIMPGAKDFFKKIKDKKLKEKFLRALNDIRQDYTIGSMKKGDLRGIYGYDVYYNRTNYEIAYSVETNDNGEIVIVILAGTRENFYKQLKRYL